MGAPLSGKAHTARTMTSARQHETRVNEPISLLRDIRTSLSISETRSTSWRSARKGGAGMAASDGRALVNSSRRSEEHTSELQSRLHLVCRLLLEITRLGSWPDTPAMAPSLSHRGSRLRT